MKCPGKKLKQLINACGKTLVVALLCLGSFPGIALGQGGGELRFCLHSEPKTFDPRKVDDDASGAIRYLTGGVLLRVNRQTQELEPGLAMSWKVSKAPFSN
jgi:peptide/nickel transport system substrate-binding protein